MRALACACVLFSTAAAAAAGEPSTGQRDFEAATAREASGDFRGAATALETMARARPDDSYAADALFEAAVLAEEHLSDPARAARLYREVLDRYPHSRLCRRAQARVDFLTASLRTGEAPLIEYQEILSGFPRRPPAESIARMERLLAANPDFSLADRALYWLGNALGTERRIDEANARFAELERRFPTSEWAARAHKSRGDLALAGGHLFEARRIYRQLAGANDPLARGAATEGLAAVSSAMRRFAALVFSIVFLLGYAGYHLRALARRRRLLRLPGEVLYYAPVALLFGLAAATENRSIGYATALIGAGGGVVVWLSTALSAARLEEGPMRRRERALRLGASAVAVIAVAFLAVQSTGLTDLVIETLKTGPER